ncbi:MAG: hypothetical protein R3D84_03495 [Paracoccaceae bacterium]
MGHQRLVSTNTSPDISDALSARIADGLWFLARQWQMGEFEGENGGAPAQIILSQRVLPFTGVTLGPDVPPVPSSISPLEPLERLVEREPDEGGQPLAWNSETLSYDFAMHAGEATLRVTGYDGRALDWHDFVPERGVALNWAPALPDMVVTPGMIAFPGAPEPRHWTIEDGAAHFDSAFDPEPNVLSMLLPEFFYTDLKNWVVAPAPMPAGAMRKIDRVEVVDSFGVVTEVGPVADAGLRLFDVMDDDMRADLPDLVGKVMMLPAVAAQVVDCDVVEEVAWLRDEASNLVWAHERRLTDPTSGESASTGTEVAKDTLTTAVAGRYFTLASDVARAYIPYVPRQLAPTDRGEGEIGLRRGRTQREATPDAPQYRSEMVGESRWLHHETIPQTGLRTRRLARYARGADGEPHFWTGRDRDITPRDSRPGREVDYLRDESGE